MYMRSLFAIAISLILLTSCAKDFYYIFGMDVDAPISVELSGSRYEWDNELFTSDSGYFSHYNHPDLVLHDDGGFSFELNRALGSEVGKNADLWISVEDEDSPYELNRVYSLIILGESRASITFSERGESYTMPNGTVVTDIIHHTYYATDGYLIFTEQSEYSGDYILSGEFRFKGVSEDGDEIYVERGTFANCRIHKSHGADCDEW